VKGSWGSSKKKMNMKYPTAAARRLARTRRFFATSATASSRGTSSSSYGKRRHNIRSIMPPLAGITS
jgi:hypothetical protein